MNNHIGKIHIIDKAELKSELYFDSLIEQAYRKLMLTDSDIERMQLECLNLLAYKTERFTSSYSSSIPIEKAKDIMASNVFTIGLWLKTFENPDEAVSALLSEPIEALYLKGRKRIDTMVSAAKTVHKKLLSKLIDTENVFYRETIEGGINGFFKLYYPDFAAQEIHITADYPIFNKMPKLEGIEFISAYLSALYYENSFCALFSNDDIHYLLLDNEEGFMAQGYQGLVINIYEKVLTAALCSIILDINSQTPDISPGRIKYLHTLFYGKEYKYILNIIQEAADSLNSHFQFSKGLLGYVRKSLPYLAGELMANIQRLIN